MAEWIIDQQTEVWFRCRVEAETFEEAVALASSPDNGADWNRLDDVEWVDKFWGENQETEEQFTSYDGVISQEQ